MPEITVPQKTAIPGTDVGPSIPIGIFDDQFAAGRGLAQAVGGAGQVVANAAVNTIRAQGAEEFTAAKLDYETEFRKFQGELLTDTDYSTYSTKFNAWHDGFTAERIKAVNHKGAIRRAQVEFDYQRAVRGRTIDSDAQTKLVREIRRTLPDKLASQVIDEIEAATPEELKKIQAEWAEYIKTITDTGAINGDEAEGIDRDLQTGKGERVLQNTINGIAVEEGWDEALDWLDDPANIKQLFDEFGIALEDVTSLTNAVRARAQRSRSDGIVTLARQREADGGEFVQRLDGLVRGTSKEDSFNDLIDDVLASTLTPTGDNSKQSWIDKINAQSKSINDGKEDPFNQTDNAVLFDLRTRIEDDPGSVTIDELREKVGKGESGGISIADYNTLFGMVTDADNPLNKPQAKRAQQVISRLRGVMLTAAAAGKEDPTTGEDLDPVEIEFNALAVQNEFDRWLLANPKATDPQIEDKLRALMRVPAEAVTLNFFEKLITPRILEAGGLAAKRSQTFRKMPIFDTLTKQEKAEAKQAFKNGFTVDDVLKVLGE